MNISAKADYAVRAMIQLAVADHQGEPLIAADQLAAGQVLPRKFLESILTDLRRAGLVRSVRGAGGGYRLAHPATDITVADIMRAVDGPLAQVHGRRPHETTYESPAEHLPVVWVAVRAALRSVLENVTLDQLRTGDFPDHVAQLAQAPQAWANR